METNFRALFFHDCVCVQGYSHLEIRFLKLDLEVKELQWNTDLFYQVTFNFLDILQNSIYFSHWLYFNSTLVILYMISIFLNLLRFILWQRIWPNLVNVPFTFENNLPSVVHWNVPYMSGMSKWLLLFVNLAPTCIFINNT